MMSKDTIEKISCPKCVSEAVYRDGKSRTGKQRHLCLMCGTQFTASHRMRVHVRPFCSTCGSPMYLYKDEEAIVCFRCSRYPLFKTYKKISKI